MKYISSDNLKAILIDLLAKVQANTNAAIASVHQLDIQIVPTKPTVDISNSTLYLVEKPLEQQTAENKYDEYMYVNGAWELYGEVTIDLSGYAKTADVTTAINAAIASALTAYSTTADMNTAITTALADKVTATQVDSQIATATADKVTAAQVDTQISTALQSLNADEITALKTELGIA